MVDHPMLYDSLIIYLDVIERGIFDQGRSMYEVGQQKAQR